MKEQQGADSRAKALLAAMSMLGAALGVAPAAAEPPPSPWGSVPTDDTGCGVTGCKPAPVSRQQKVSNQLKHAEGGEGDGENGGVQRMTAGKTSSQIKLQGNYMKIESHQQKGNGTEGGQIPK